MSAGDVQEAVEDARYAINYADVVLSIIESGGVLTPEFLTRFRAARVRALNSLDAAMHTAGPDAEPSP